MGLTIHYRLTAPAGATAREAAAIVRRLHATALAMASSGRVPRVLPVSADRGELERFASAWRAVPHPQDPEATVGVSVAPKAGWIFPVELGAECEPLWLGLCRYPASVRHGGRRIATGLAERWQLE